MKTIQILGSGCAKCKNLAAAADLAAKELGQGGDPRGLLALEIAAVFDSEGKVRDTARKSAEQLRKALSIGWRV